MGGVLPCLPLRWVVKMQRGDGSGCVRGNVGVGSSASNERFARIRRCHLLPSPLIIIIITVRPPDPVALRCPFQLHRPLPFAPSFFTELGRFTLCSHRQLSLVRRPAWALFNTLCLLRPHEDRRGHASSRGAESTASLLLRCRGGMQSSDDDVPLVQGKQNGGKRSRERCPILLPEPLLTTSADNGYSATLSGPRKAHYYTAHGRRRESSPESG